MAQATFPYEWTSCESEYTLERRIACPQPDFQYQPRSVSPATQYSAWTAEETLRKQAGISWSAYLYTTKCPKILAC